MQRKKVSSLVLRVLVVLTVCAVVYLLLYPQNVEGSEVQYVACDGEFTELELREVALAVNERPCGAVSRTDHNVQRNYMKLNVQDGPYVVVCSNLGIYMLTKKQPVDFDPCVMVECEGRTDGALVDSDRRIVPLPTLLKRIKQLEGVPAGNLHGQ